MQDSNFKTKNSCGLRVQAVSQVFSEERAIRNSRYCNLDLFPSSFFLKKIDVLPIKSEFMGSLGGFEGKFLNFSQGRSNVKRKKHLFSQKGINRSERRRENQEAIIKLRRFSFHFFPCVIIGKPSVALSTWTAASVEDRKGLQRNM